ncbi:hypothetical protein [Nocardia cyriacigeorgica]|uniref:hypothetical protein n=1 Tax=Nocardia cyriacigeorgica TaxID=135487 RepID=UPI002453B1C2|nr:hypothetical protein [Nocardia cyriacigeorgica]
MFTVVVRRLARAAVFAKCHVLPDPRAVFRLGDIIAEHKDSALGEPSVGLSSFRCKSVSFLG